jgi:hypothetical protein
MRSKFYSSPLDFHLGKRDLAIIRGEKHRLGGLIIPESRRSRPEASGTGASIEKAIKLLGFTQH